MKEEKNKSLDTEQIYGHESQRGLMARVTSWLIASSKLLLCSAKSVQGRYE
jgi:hypothetical protein